MTLTREDREGVVRAFSKAKEYLEAHIGEKTYICIVIEHVVRAVAGRHRSLATRIIQERLRNGWSGVLWDTSLEFWVARSLPEEQWKSVIDLTRTVSGDPRYAMTTGAKGDEQMRLYRIRWLEELIREFS